MWRLLAALARATAVVDKMAACLTASLAPQDFGTVHRADYGAAQKEAHFRVTGFCRILYCSAPQPVCREPDTDACISFVKKQAEELGLPHRVYTVLPQKPIIILTWEGTDPSLPSILLNSHMDVVPVFPEHWIHPPFSAHLTEDGKIYARGSQDMKCVGIQYLEAVKKIKEKGIRLKRTVHISFVPDEETGGSKGMRKFVVTEDFKALNIGLSLDEGLASSKDHYYVFNGERSIWHVNIVCSGTSGHGSILLPNTAGEKIRVVIDKFMDYRDTQKKRLADNTSMTLGDVTSINITQLFGGVQNNVVPESLTVAFDVRLAVDVDHVEFLEMIKGWCREAGEGIVIEFEQKDPKNEVTKLDDSNPFWVAFKKASDELNINLLMHTFPGGTDSRFLRQVGLPAIGFSPMNRTKPLLHSHNENLDADMFLKGIDIYEKLIPAVADV